MIDEDMVNTLVAEDRRERYEERQLKNKILAIGNEERKAKEWHKHFASHQAPDDSYLAGNVF